MIPRAYPIRRFARTVGFGAITAAVLPALLAHQAVVPHAVRDSVREQWLGTWSSALLSVFGVRVIARGATSARTRGRLIVANHRSAADIPVLLREFGGRMVSRADLAHWALIGPWARAVGTVFVDRSDPASGAAALRAIRAHLAEGSTITVFPEGTTFHDDEVRPFQVGAFAAALRARAEVVAVGLAYETGSGAAFGDEPFATHLARMASAAPSRVALAIGAPIVSGGKMGAAALRDRARAEVQRLVGEARYLVDSREPVPIEMRSASGAPLRH
jgi:1-acyl-sn-glycerol-3-phosphate acyltransferase